MSQIFSSPESPYVQSQIDQDAERRRQEAEAKAAKESADLKAKQEEEADALRRGLRGRRALQGAGGELGYASKLGAG